jgi:hypothetical protein
MSRSMSLIGAVIAARMATLWGVIDGPIGDALPYAAAAGALGVIIKAMSFLNTYQDRIVNGLDAQLIQARSDIEILKVEHRRDIEQIRRDASREVEARDRYIQYLIGQIEDVRKQAGLPERRQPPPPMTTYLNDAPDDAVPPS